MTTASKITMVRIALIPVIIFLLYTAFVPYGRIMVVLLFILASVTDAVDGYYARRFKQVTSLGKFLDPLADKLLIISVFVCMIELRIIPAIPVVIIIAREFAVTGLRLIAASDGKVIDASKFGKYKTVAQVITVVVLFLNMNIGIYILWLTVLITLASGMDYFLKNLKVFSDGEQ